MQMPLKLPRQYWHVVDKTFKQYLLIWSPGIKNIWEVKGEFQIPTASRGELYGVCCTSEKEIQMP
jgi:hypothetical protein